VVLFISLLTMATVVSIYAAAYYGIAGIRDRQRLEKRLEQLGMTPQMLESSRRSVLLRWGDWFDRTRWGMKVAARLAQADLPLKPSEFIGILAGAMLLLMLAISAVFHLRPLLNLIMAGIIVALLARLYLDARRDHYLTKLSAQMPEVAVLISNSLKAGLSVPQAFQVVVDKMTRPAKQEFSRICQEIRLGAMLDEAMARMMERLPSDELHIMLTTIMIQRKAGGDLARALAVMSEAISARHRLRNEINTLTAEARFTSLAIMIMPIVILAILNQMMPGSVTDFLSNPIGWIITGLFTAIQVAGFLLIRRIANVQV